MEQALSLLQQQVLGNEVGRRGPYLAPRMEPHFPRQRKPHGSLTSGQLRWLGRSFSAPRPCASASICEPIWLATALCLNAVDHRLQFLGSVDREHLAHVVEFLAPVLEPQQPAGMVGPQLPVTGKRKLPRLATEHRNPHPLVSLNRSRQRV